tara:strand:+ start:377 stop:1309 length:933 start_codon:yes stop_codon:yes gene_type:complete
MINVEPIQQTKLYGLNKYLDELTSLISNNKMPSKILISGQKGSGKATLAYHLINYALSVNENNSYNLENCEIDPQSHSFKTISNGSNPNLILIDISSEKKNIDINQIRELISKLNKSSLNNKPRFVLIDNIEFLNINSINALLKVLEEPNENTFFILINSSKKVLPTIKSRCIDYKISLNNKECVSITNELVDNKLHELINKDITNYYLTPGNFLRLIKFSNDNNFNLSSINLRDFLKKIIRENYYKKDNFIKYFIFEFIHLYFLKNKKDFSFYKQDEYLYFIKKINDTNKYNLDLESLFIEFEQKVLDE